MAVTLYKKQKQIYDYLCQYIQKNDFAPTLKEIADAMHVNSVATIHEHLKALEDKNLIRRSKGKNRSIELTNRTFLKLTEGVDLPITGFLRHGEPLITNVRTDQTFRVSPELITGKKRAFILQIQGDNWDEDLLTNGDYLVLEEEKEVANGTPVVVVLENGAITICKYFREATRLRLEKMYNLDAMPIYAGQVQILGQIMGMIRKNF
ncbi:repressor LexA [bacterium]|nr:repressor LexA [bacterium]